MVVVAAMAVVVVATATIICRQIFGRIYIQWGQVD